MNEKLDRLHKKALSLPQTPGVYIMKNKANKIIYVGKAKALKNRVSQYFTQRQHTLDIKVQRMVEAAQDFDYILTDSEFEALVLECSLIKQHAPKYNILLKDDKGYRYIRVTGGEWPNFYAVKRKDDDGATYIGPYINAYAVINAVDEAKKIFRIPQCNKVFPRDIGKERPCLHHFIRQCSAPCARKIDRESYTQAVTDALAFIRGGESKTLEALHARMEAAVEALDFEQAAKLRDSIRAIERTREKQKVVVSTYPEQDVFALVCEAQVACLAVLRFQDGRLYDSEHFMIEKPENLEDARRELLQQFYAIRDFVPRRITLDGPAQQSELLEEWLSQKAGRRVQITVPEKGEQKQLVQMCRSNAVQQLAQRSGRSAKSTAALDELATLLRLPAPPQYIEAYDISHHGGDAIVAGMVVFVDGKPSKRNYKRFSLRDMDSPDDYAALAQVLTRRFLRYEQEKDAEEGFGRLPDLILLDGGIGQVHAVQPVLAQMGITVPLFGMVKDSRHRTRAIAADGGELALGSKRQAFTLVSTIQEEVHRWAIDYHRKKRQGSISSTLTAIPGVGESRAKTLMSHFKTIQAIREATLEQLQAVPGMPKPVANAIYTAFRA